MVDSTDLEAAVRAGIVPGETVDRLRSFSAERRGVPAADEERFGLIGGLADIMSSAELVLLLGAVAMLLFSIAPIAAALLPPVAWLLAEHFTRKRRLTLASFVLFALFAIAWAMACLGVALLIPFPASTRGLATVPDALPALPGLIVAAATAMGCAAWWIRFHLPIAYAATVMAGVNVMTHVARLAVPDAPAWLVSIYLVLIGIVIFLLAMWWDMSDVRRETRRADVGFWLHAMAGYQIANASFRLIFGVAGDPVGWGRLYSFTSLAPDGTAIIGVAIAVLAAFCLVALAVDRRSLLMSSIAFVLPAMIRATTLSGDAATTMGAVSMGALLLALSYFWTPGRAAVLAVLPLTLRAQLPRTTIRTSGQRPVM
jgi:hypothetical protein